MSTPPFLSLLKRPPAPSTAPGNAPPDTWRSLAERENSPAFRAAQEGEFPAGVSEWSEGLSRRDFLQVMGASLALTGLAGCNRLPRDKILPYVTPPEKLIPGQSVFYASAMPTEGYGRGILVQSHLGRPTKIEGNPHHPESLGATDAITQAAVLSLYDPDRSRTPRRDDLPSLWETFEAEWTERHHDLDTRHGTGLAIVTEPTTSPTTLREIHGLLTRFPSARWYQHTPLARYDFAGAQLDYDFSAADVIFSIESDFLAAHPSSLRYSRAFSQRRRVEQNQVKLNTLYAIEATPTITGSMADERLPLSPARQRQLLNAIAVALGFSSAAAPGLSGPERRFVDALVRDLKAHAPNVVCVAGASHDEEVHRWTAVINARLGAHGPVMRTLPVVRSDADQAAAGGLTELVAAIDRSEIQAVVLLGTNPAYTAPADLDFTSRLKQVPFRMHVGPHYDETAALCQWHLPESHFLESWSDLVGYDGTTTIVQPLIEPLYSTRSIAEVLHLLREPPGRAAYDLVRDTWQAIVGGPDFDARWEQWLNQGKVAAPPRAPAPSARASEVTDVPLLTVGDVSNSPLLLFRPDPNVSDGRWANNAWLQELPKPFTRLVWDNAALISPAFARAHALKNGDLIRIERSGVSLEAPVWIMAGQEANCITLPLGYGRTRAGQIGDGCGFNAYPLRTRDAPWTATGAKITPIGRNYLLVSTEGHFDMAGRDLVRTVAPAQLVSLEPEKAPTLSLYPDIHYTSPAWGMSIDLSTCTGCNACVVACQAENNIPVVGKDQASRGREMHWLRIDRYYQGEPDNPRFLHQPVPCMQCENAPCEVVCPVAATVHSSEGLNDMVYNRCVGTRYCSNNCPYKVRRFNFLHYAAPEASPVHLQENPNVTVRARGVMEKCTYCVQRINAARIAAEKENRGIRDGEAKTACQQVCPVEAIVFGDIADPHSRVAQRKREQTDYALLGELNTRPRTTYLARVVRTTATS